MSLSEYRNTLRVRVCGILIEDNQVLLVHLLSPVSNSMVWMPPGGGLEFGESIEECLKREFKEETGFQVQVKELAFVDELVRPPFHALELYYYVNKESGSLKRGRDPEHDSDLQLIDEVGWIPLSQLSSLSVAPERLVTYLSSK